MILSVAGLLMSRQQDMVKPSLFSREVDCGSRHFQLPCYTDLIDEQMVDTHTKRKGVKVTKWPG
jgi:hypothetical protein